jgi:hypothetical protein
MRSHQGQCPFSPQKRSGRRSEVPPTQLRRTTNWKKAKEEDLQMSNNLTAGRRVKAEDVKLGRFVALKFLPDDVAKEPRVKESIRSQCAERCNLV